MPDPVLINALSSRATADGTEILPHMRAGDTEALGLTVAAIKALGVTLSSSDPTTSQNEASGYINRWVWKNSTTGHIWILLVASTGTWLDISASGTGVTLPGSAAGTFYADDGTFKRAAQVIESAADPTADDDVGDGYYPGDVWRNTSSGDQWDMLDNSSGAAIWTPRSGGVTTVTSHAPGSTLTLTLTDGSSHLVTLSEDCTITLASSVADGTVEHAELDLDRQGYTVTWANLDQGEGDLDLSGAAGVVENLAVRVTYVSSAAYFHAIQYGAAGAGTALPATGLQAVHRLESDAADSVNSNDLTLQASASIVGSGQHGLSLASASSQYASRASAIIDPGADFTWVGAFANIDTAPGTDEAIVSWGSSSGGDPYLVLRWNVTGTLYAQAKDDTGANGSPASIAIGSLPADDMLVMLARNGSTLVLKCLSNGVTSNGTFPAGGMTCDQFALGCRMKGTPAFDWFYNGGSSRPILADAMWDRYVSGTTEQNQVRQWFIDDRGLSGV